VYANPFLCPFRTFLVRQRAHGVHMAQTSTEIVNHNRDVGNVHAFTWSLWEPTPTSPPGFNTYHETTATLRSEKLPGTAVWVYKHCVEFTSCAAARGQVSFCVQPEVILAAHQIEEGVRRATT
jgi:hypothetical protein